MPVASTNSMKALLILCACALAELLVFPTSAAVAQNIRSGESAYDLAKINANLAGAARKCELDSEDIDEFISRTEGQLSAMARDDLEAAALRVDFKNLLVVASGRLEGTPDCLDVAQRLRDRLRRLTAGR